MTKPAGIETQIIAAIYNHKLAFSANNICTKASWAKLFVSAPVMLIIFMFFDILLNMPIIIAEETAPVNDK